MAPASAQRLALDAAHDLRFDDGFAAGGIVECGGIAVDHRLHHPHRDDAGQVGAARGGGQRQAQSDQVMRGIADHRLVEIADLDFHRTLAIGDWPQIAEMAIAADPDGRSLRNAPRRVGRRQPFVEFRRVAANIGMGGSRHFQRAPGFQKRMTIGGQGHV